MLLRGFATADASSLIEEAAFFEDLFLSNGRFDAGNHFYDNAVLRPLRETISQKTTSWTLTYLDEWPPSCKMCLC